MVKRSQAVRWAVIAVAALGLGSLYARALASGFLNDDYLFLEEAKRRSLAAALSGLGALGNYYRPISRQLYFALLGPLAGGRPLLFHLVNFGLFLGSLVLLADLLAAFLPVAGVAAGLLYFATLPFQRVNLTWISCAQDLLALFFSLAAVACWRRGRDGWAAAAYLLAVFSKESALPLPLVLALWPARQDESGSGPSAALRRRLAPFGAVAALWLAATIWMRGHETRTLPTLLHFTPESFAAGWVHEIQSLLGLDHPPGFGTSLLRNGPAPLALLCLGAVVFLLPPPAPRGAEGRPWLESRVSRFAALWLLAFGFVVGPVAATWSSYYYTLAAVGAALLVGSAFRRVSAPGWLMLAGGLLWWHAAGAGVRAFAVADRPWGWTTHLSSFYFERADSLTRDLGRDLVRLEPRPARGTRFFFANLPSFAGFQMGNGAQVRALYGDPTLESYFYSQFSDSTADAHPCRFYWYEGAHLKPLFPPGVDTFFQVGSDLLLFGKLEGARYAFLRGLAAGEHSKDLDYWLGWTELWRGHRAAAEAAWTAFGAHDDSLRWWVRMRVARQLLLVNRDTLETKRQLAVAIQSGIGRPEAHAVLGDLLMQEHPKYGLLELKIAASLNPYDWVARRGMLQGFVTMQLDDLARAQLEELKRIEPRWEQDSLVTAAAATLERRSAAARPVVQF